MTVAFEVGKNKTFSQYFRAWSCPAVKARNSVIGQYSSDTDFPGDLSVSGDVAGSGYLNSLGQWFMVSQPNATGHEPLLPAHNSEHVISTC